MPKDFHYKIYSSIISAARINNEIMTTPKLSFLDCSLLCLIKSFYDSKKEFYMTNEQLANTFLACERSIRSSINRLCQYKFITKKYIDNSPTKGRILFYQKENVDRFISNMLDEGK